MKYLNNNKIFVFSLLTTLIFWGCKDKEKEIASIPVKEIHLENFEEEIFSLNDKNFAEQNKILPKKYSPFYQYFCQKYRLF
jgi:hypothetical protein